MNESNQSILSQQITEAKQSIEEGINAIGYEAKSLKMHAKRMNFYHQIFTVSTILLGVSAPAMVTYSPTSYAEVWKLVAIVITAFATASATMRTVLRFGERYSNSELASLELFNLKNKVQGKMKDILVTVKDEFIPLKISEISIWAGDQMFNIVKSYSEREVAALTKDKIELTEPPKINQEEKIDKTQK